MPGRASPQRPDAGIGSAGFREQTAGARRLQNASAIFEFYSVIVGSAVPAGILGVQVTEHGPETRIIAVTGELDALTAPVLATVSTETLVTAGVVVVALDGVQYLASVGCGR